MLMLEDRNVFDMNIHVEQTHSVFLFLSAASVSYGNHKYLAFFSPLAKHSNDGMESLGCGSGLIRIPKGCKLKALGNK